MAANRQEAEGGKSRSHEESGGTSWWRSRWFYEGMGWLLTPLPIFMFGAGVFHMLPFFFLMLVFCSLLIIPLTIFPVLNTNLNKRAIALIERERIIRKDLKGGKALLVSVDEILSPVFPHYLDAAWRINLFEHSKSHTHVDMKPDHEGMDVRIKLVISFSDMEPRVEGMYRYDEETMKWLLVFEIDPASRNKIERRPFALTREYAHLPSLLALLLIGIPGLVLGISAPCRALLLMFEPVFPLIGRNFIGTLSLFGVSVRTEYLDITGGACGVLIGILAAYRVGFWQFLQARQVKNIPTSNAQSAAIGLAEFRGVARGRNPVARFTSAYTEETTSQILRPFILEDASGTIQVDPEGSVIRPSWSLQFLQRMVGNVVLTRRVCPRTYGQKEIRELRDGDPVYVLGSVEMNPDAPPDSVDAGRLVVRKGRRQVSVPFLYRLLNVNRQPEKFTYLDVFFLSDTPEKGAYDWIMADLRKTVLVAIVWMGLSAWLLWQGWMSLKLIS